MHSLIGIIVYAECKDEALEEGQETLESLCADGGVFEYGTTFDEKWARDRWGELESVMEAESEEGSAFIEKLQSCTKGYSMHNMKNLRRILTRNKTDDLYEQTDRDIENDVRLYAYKLGQFRGSEIKLYTWECEGIRTPRDLDHALTRYACIYEDIGKPNPYADLTVYVVPADVHY